MPNFGPVSCSLGPGSSTPYVNRCNLFDSGQTGQLITECDGSASIQFNGVTSSSWGVKVECFDYKDTLIVQLDGISSTVAAHNSGTWSLPTPAGTSRILVQFACSFHAGDVGTVTAQGSYNTSGYCQYGTQLQPGAAATAIITSALIDTVLAEINAPWLAFVLAPLIGQTANLSDLCASGPGPMPTIDLSTLDASINTAWSIFKCSRMCATIF